MRGDGEDWEGQGQPVHPVSHALSIPPLSVCVNVVFEFEEPITDISRAKKVIVNALLPRNPHFSCIMKEDDRGVLRWQKTTVNIDDHIFIAEFPPKQESYDACVDDYISKMALKPLDQSRPLWELHFMDYKTSKAEATVLIKLHHSLGDGISFMSTLFSLATRVDNPDLPPTFPTAKRSYTKPMATSKQSIAAKYFQRLWYVMIAVWYTIIDVTTSLLRTTGWMADSQLPIRGPPEVQFMPVALSSITLNLEDIRQIKNSMGGTVNDVATGIIFYGMQRYLQIHLSAVEGKSLRDAYEKRFEPLKASVIKQLNNSRITALCLLNTRVLAGIQSIEEMLKPETQAPWGNHFAFLHVPVPIMGKVGNPLEFVKRAKRIIDRYKMSLAVFCNAAILRWLARLEGPHAIMKSLYSTVVHTSMIISNVIGPMEKVAIDGNPLKSCSFFVTGAPISLYVSILTYMDTLKIQVIAPKDLIDVNMLCKCFTEAFEEMEASTHGKSL
eukprot:PITA_26266